MLIWFCVFIKQKIFSIRHFQAAGYMNVELSMLCLRFSQQWRCGLLAYNIVQFGIEPDVSDKHISMFMIEE
jgi:hypothetical protein